MSSATVTSKGQVTIPIDVRTRLGLKPGSRLVFVPWDNGGFEIYPVAGSIKKQWSGQPWALATMNLSSPTLLSPNSATSPGATTR